MKPSLFAAGALGLAALVTGCGPSSKYLRGGGAIAPLEVDVVDWNPGKADVSHARAVADDGDDVVVFGDAGAQIFRGGALVATPAASAAFVDAAVIPALDGSGKWIVGVDASGRAYRVRGRTSLEPISDRFGLVGDHVGRVRALGGALIGFDDGGRLAIADEQRLAHFGLGGLRDLAGGGGYGAAIADGPDAPWIRLLDVRHGDDRTFALPDARFVALDDAGTLFAASSRGVWSLDGDRLRLRYASNDATLHGLVGSAVRAWAIDGDALATFEAGADGALTVRATTAAAAPADARLFGSASGDVWTVSSHGVARIRARRASQTASLWEHDVAPIFHRVCATCHEAGGDGGVELATESQWIGKRDVIRARVVDKRNMPPRGFSITDDERAAIARWLGDKK
jgi:hypothetical protein